MLIDRYQSLIYSLVLKMGLKGTDAEDAFQEVCIKFYRHLGQLRESQRLPAWLASVVKQHIWGLWRKRKISHFSDHEPNIIEQASPVIETQGPSVEDQLMLAEREEMVRHCARQLSPECQSLLAALYGADSSGSYEDVAADLGMPLGSIGPRRGRCLERLRKLLSEQGY